MAELNVVPKKKSPLPWILLALVVLGIVAWLLLRNNDVAPDRLENQTDTTTGYESPQNNTP